MKRKFELTLAILESKPNITIDFTSKILTNDIMSAQDDFDIYHKGKLKLVITAITKSMINAEIEIEVEQNEKIVLYRKIGLFSRRLCNKYDWKQYSNMNSRLLTIVSSREIGLPATYIEASICEPEQVGERINFEVINMKLEKLRYLYAEKRYIQLQILEIEHQGITLD